MRALYIHTFNFIFIFIALEKPSWCRATYLQVLLYWQRVEMEMDLVALTYSIILSTLISRLPRSGYLVLKAIHDVDLIVEYLLGVPSHIQQDSVLGK